MTNKQSLLLLIVTILLILMAGNSFGQIIYGQKSSGDVSMIYSSWKIETLGQDVTISQFSIPIGGFIPIQDNFEARFYFSNSFNNLDAGIDDYSLSGLGDLRVQFNRSFENDKYLLSVGFNLPIGKKKLSSVDEQVIINWLSESFLTFPTRKLGEGFGINAMAGVATSWDNIRAGCSAMYQLNGSYNPYDDLSDYDPGDFFTLSGSADLQNNDWLYMLNLAYTLYVDDKIDGEKTFKQADNFDARISATYKQDKIDYSGTVRLLVRGENSIGDFIDNKLFGNEFSIYLNANYHPGGKWSLVPVFEYVSIADNDLNIGNSSLVGFGGDYFTELTESIDLRLGAKYYIGSALNDVLDVTGIQLSTSLMASF